MGSRRRKNDFDEKNFFEELHIKYQKDYERRKEIEESTDYIDELFYLMNNSSRKISSNMFLYEECIDEKSENIVNSLNIFFDIIDSYAQKNLIKSYDETFGHYYYVSYHDKIMILGERHGQGSYIYAQKVDIVEENMEVISYEELLSNLIPSYCMERIKAFENIKVQLNEFFDALIKSGMTKEQCKDYLESYLNNLE